MKYEDFEREVRTLLHNDEKWLHILPSVPALHRIRFISVLKAGIDAPLAFDLVLAAKDMGDVGFNERLQKLRPK